ncbi:MAG: glycosyltransferase family 39 protein [Victivallaceae bacterium]|nr:glycosyltransferase family 39 protein [Victivallaceae bacterium]
MGNGLSRTSALALLLVLTIPLAFMALECREICSGDETRVAGISMGMLYNETLVCPQLNGEPFLEYPPLYYWSVAAFLKWLGTGRIAVKLSSAICFVGSVMATYALARRLDFSRNKALFAAWALSVSPAFFKYGRTCMTDIMLSFFALTACSAFYFLATERGAAVRKSMWFLLFSAAVAGGTMTKGVFGFLMPCAVSGAFTFLSCIADRKWHWARWMQLALAMLIATIPVAAWGTWLYRDCGTDALHVVAITNTIGRFAGSQGDHVEKAYYYLTKLGELFQPWLVPAVLGFALAVTTAVKRHLPADLFLICFCLVPGVALSVSAAKRLVYTLPMYPAVILLATNGIWYLADVVKKHVSAERISYCLRFAMPTAATLIMLYAVVLVLVFRNEGMTFVYPMLAALACLATLVAPKKQKWIGLMFCVVLCVIATDATIVSKTKAEEDLSGLFRETSRLLESGETVRVSKMERTRGAANYYLERNLPVFRPGDSVNGREYRILRNKEKGMFGDRHHIMVVDGEGQREFIPASSD